MKRTLSDAVLSRRRSRRPLRRPTTSRRGRIWQFINSGVGLWLLSTIFVSLGGWGYAELTASIRQRDAKRDELIRVRSEIYYRLDHTLYSLMATKADAVDPAQAIEKANADYLLPEFRRHKLIRLVYRYADLTSNRDAGVRLRLDAQRPANT